MENSEKKRSIPNDKLRKEREIRGWTHKDIADQISLPDPHTVSRWERGVSFPHPHYRQALSRIFEKELEQLGLLHSSDHEEEQPFLQIEEIRQRESSARLPHFFTSFVGRDHEIAMACEQLRRPDVHLLVLLGAGGIGKTRVAIQIAMQMRDEFADDICFISLAALRDPSQVIPAIAEGLGIQERETLPLIESVKNVLRKKSILVLIDNFEQVITAAPFIEEILQDCLEVKVLVTSREVLHLQAEHEFVLSPLPLPDLKQPVKPDVLMQYASVVLFIQRAQMQLPTFQVTEWNAAAVAELCVRLDGLPLAIELAAAYVKLFTPQALLVRLSQGLHILKSNVRTIPERQRTLNYTIQWSYDLLDVQEQRLFRYLSVGIGGMALETIEALFGVGEHQIPSVIETVKSLLDKSLLVRTSRENEEPYFTMLETLREYGRNCIQANGELEACQRAYAFHYLSVVEQAAPHLKGEMQAVWLQRLEREQENLWAALRWLIEQNETISALRFCEAFGKFCGLHGYWSKERYWLNVALALPYAPEQNAIRARVLRRAGHLAYRLRDLAEARAFQEESIIYSSSVGDKQNLAGSLSSLGWILYRQNEIMSAGQMLRESVEIARESQDTWAIANTLESLGRFMHYQGNRNEARSLLEESVALARKAIDKESLARILTTLVALEITEGNLLQARAISLESYNLAQELGTRPLIALVLDCMGEIAFFQGNYDEAKMQLEQRIMIARELDDISTIVNRKLKLADIVLAQGNTAQAGRMVSENLPSLRMQGDIPNVVFALSVLGDMKRMDGEPVQAKALYLEALQQHIETLDKRCMSRCLIGLAMIELDRGQTERSASLFGAAESCLNLPLALTIYPTQRGDYERSIEQIRANLGETLFAQAMLKGQTLSLEQIFAMFA